MFGLFVFLHIKLYLQPCSNLAMQSANSFKSVQKRPDDFCLFRVDSRVSADLGKDSKSVKEDTQLEGTLHKNTFEPHI